MRTTFTIDSIPASARLLDVRPSAAFNGWPLAGESRGGHLPGATLFSAAWAERSFDGELVDRLAAKGVTPADEVVVYGYDDAGSAVVADRLGTLGYDRVGVLAGGQPAWAADGRELVTLPRLHQLVHVGWLRALLAGEPVEAAPAGDVKVFHVNFGVPADYHRGHIPGAYHLDTNVLESRYDWNRRTPGELEAALARLGISRHTPVVVYGNDTARDPREEWPGRRAGQIAATRAAAILHYAGVEDVRLLDGGLNSWRAAGYPVETVARLPEPAAPFGSRVPARPGVFIDYDEVVDLLAGVDTALVSIRSRPENAGLTSGYNYIEERGDIPGAVWGDNGSDAYHMENYRNVDNTMRDFTEIERNWKGRGLTADQRVSFYCGTGWRASETYFYAHLLGWDDISIYDGGWFDWSRRNGATA